MAAFLTSFNKAMKWEGKYSNSSRDPGGETYCGISRRYWSGWMGWYIIDSCKDDANFPNCLDLEGELPRLVHDFYVNNFWKPLLCSDINSQNIADKFFSMSLPLGIKKATILMQESILSVIENIRHCKPYIIKVDGKMGSATLAALNGVIQDALLDEFKDKCIIEFKSKNKPEFERGWINRVIS